MSQVIETTTDAQALMAVTSEANAGSSMTRREFMRWMGAVATLLGTEGCVRRPLQKIVPYSRMPEELIPGRPLFFASSFPSQGFSMGILVESHEGRPTKIEGNTLHPASLGACDIFMQASLLGLYDPDRAQIVTHRRQLTSWDNFGTSVQEVLKGTEGVKPRIRILTAHTTSPTLISQLSQFEKQYPGSRWHVHEPLGQQNALLGSKLAFQTEVDPVYDLSRAKVILSLDCDFLTWGSAHLHHARQFGKAREVTEKSPVMNRLYVVESTRSLTGASADHRLALRPSEVGAFLEGLRQLASGRDQITGTTKKWEKFLGVLWKDLKAHASECLVMAGESLPPEGHAAVHFINQKLGNFGRTVTFLEPIAQESRSAGSLEELVHDMQEGVVDALFILGTNPAYSAPAIRFCEALGKVKYRACLAEYDDETARLCDWLIPKAHYLESWGDLRAFDGTAAIQQPLIAPLYDGKSDIEFMALLLGQKSVNGDSILKSYWKSKAGISSFDKQWDLWLEAGVIPKSEAKPKSVSGVVNAPEITSVTQGPFEVRFTADPSIGDGSHSNNGWLQELPKPFTHVTWNNVVLVGEQTALELQVSDEDLVEITTPTGKISGPIAVVPGQPQGVFTLFFGYGRENAGVLGSNRGYNAYAVRSHSREWSISGVTVKKLSASQPLAFTHGHHEMEGRDIVRFGSLAQFVRDPKFLHHERYTEKEFQPNIPVNPDLFPPAAEPYAWGMSINLGSCIGCNSCVIACQTENNIPIVGPEEVKREHEMHWIRVDTYFEGKGSSQKTLFQPVPCMHCETAPCELVCPVGATNHSHEGLNQMVYNRCVGTRYCSNNCPYKVRRFNFFNYTDSMPKIRKMAQNPDVTVRSRGVMEKCTYCVQRINDKRLTAEKENRLVRDGEIKTACQQSCPTNAIVFGNLKDKASRVSKLKENPLDYGLLAELNTKPRTTYLARVMNPNPELVES